MANTMLMGLLFAAISRSLPVFAAGYAHAETALAVSISFSRKGDVYNVLWVLVFAFATLNILGLVARRFDPDRARLSLGETFAILVVIVSILLLAWEMLYLFKVLPIRLSR